MMIRGGSIRMRGDNEPSLIRLVETYLADNSNLSYINIDDMIDYFRSQYHRFARMQRKVFANQVRGAYFEYCRRNVGQTNGPRPANGGDPARNATAGPVAAPDESDNSDVEVEEVEEPEPRGARPVGPIGPGPRVDIMNANVTAMYRNIHATNNGGVGSTGAAQPSTSAPRTSSQAQAVSQPDIPITTTPAANNEDSSDDDLEIVDEIQGTPTTPARNVIQRLHEENMLGLVTVSSTPNNVPHPAHGGLVFNRVPQDTSISVNHVPAPVVQPREHPSNLPFRPLETHFNKTSRKSDREVTPSRTTRAGGSSSQEKSDKDSSVSQRGVKRKIGGDDGSVENQITKKLKKEIVVVQDSGYRLHDFAGSEKVVEEVCRLLMHLKHPEVYKTLGVTPPRGFLLHGPPGTGKTLLANAIAGEMQLPLLKVTGTEFISGISGESEGNIRDLFNQALAIAPCIVFIDEIDSVTPKRETAQREMERRIVAQLISCVDDLLNQEKGNQVLLIGATNRIEAIDTALRRAGRFDKEICLGIPDEGSRQKILNVICKNLRLAPGFNLGTIAKLTPGYVGADLQLLVREAAVQAVNKALLAACEKNEEKQRLDSEEFCSEDFDFDEPMIISVVSTSKVIEPESASNPIDPRNCSQNTLEVAREEGSSDAMEDLQPVEISPAKDGLKTDDANAVCDATTTVITNKMNGEAEAKNEVSSSNDGEKSESVQQDSGLPPQAAEKPETNSVEEADSKTDTIEVGTKNVAEAQADSMTETIDPQVETKSQNETEPLTHPEEVSTVDANIVSETESVPTVVTSEGSAALVDANEKNNQQIESVTDSSKPIEDDKMEVDELDGQSEKIYETEAETCKDEDQSHLRWIKELAPLNASQLDELYIFMEDFEIAIKHVQPSSKREGFATVPDITWDDIGALADIREELEVSILGPVKYSQAFKTLGLMSPSGVLLCGPPGCGKTLVAKAVANEAGINFISVKGPELLNMYVGESERAVRQCFNRAKNSSPCVIFFDEIDALCPRRSDNPDSGSGSRIVNQLLTEMDGVEGREGVFIMAATNRPDILDPAILRPGRLDKVLFVDLPNASDRYEILKAITKNGSKPTLDTEVDLKAIAENKQCGFYTGADLAALVREASVAAFKDLVRNNKTYNPNELKVSPRHFEAAFLKTKPSVTPSDRAKYEEMKIRYSVVGQ